MISSMTGFARRSSDSQWGDVHWELRSLNHRTLEISLNMPEQLRYLEKRCRQALAKKFSRGRIDATVKVHFCGRELTADSIDDKVIKSIAEVSERIHELFPDCAGLSASELLHWPGVIAPLGAQDTEFDEFIFENFLKALEDLASDRLREGAQIQAVLEQKLASVLRSSEQAAGLIAEAQRNARERLSERLDEVEVELDPTRLEQEVALLLIKSDVSEEFDRFRLHASEFRRILDKESAAGKRLGFVLQEMNREANTLASKSTHYPLNSLMVDMKVVLEQIREQIQNIA